MLRRFSVFTAYVSHPVLTPFYLTAILHLLCPGDFPTSIGLLFLITVLFPIVILWVMKHFKWLTSLSEMSLKERRLTLAISGIYYLGWMVWVRGTPYDALCASIVWCHFFLYGFSFKQKPSLHTYSWIGGGWVLVGSNLFTCPIPVEVITIWFVISGVVIASRLYLRAHTIKEVIIATIISTVSVILVFLTHYGI